MINLSTQNVFVGVGKSSERKLPLHTLEKIHSYHDFEFDLDDNIVTVWRQYGIGVGKEISYCYPTDLSSGRENKEDYSYATIMSWDPRMYTCEDPKCDMAFPNQNKKCVISKAGLIPTLESPWMIR